jgi:hypothetical protein
VRFPQKFISSTGPYIAFLEAKTVYFGPDISAITLVEVEQNKHLLVSGIIEEVINKMPRDLRISFEVQIHS